MNGGRSAVFNYYVSFNNGKSFGLGITLNKKVDAKGNASWGVGMPVKCSFNDRARDILPTIGQGEITLPRQGGLEFLNRNVGTHIGATSSESASLDARGKIKKVALPAVMHKMIVIFNNIVKNSRPSQDSSFTT